MKSFKIIQNKGQEIFIVAVIVTIILLVAAQNLFSQINIRDIAVDALKRPKTTDAKDRSSSRTEQTSTSSSVQSDDPPNWFLNVIASDIEKAKAEVDIYTPEGRRYLVSTPLAPWLLRAVSEKAREEFSTDKKLTEWRKANPNNKFDSGLKALAESAAKKLPTYLPNANKFALRDAALEKLIKTKLKNAATVKTLKIGIMHSGWQIEKNDLGIPTNRYREAFIWGKDPSDDHPYCNVYGFVIQQDYSGGGTYGATGAYLNTDVLVGCPAG